MSCRNSGTGGRIVRPSQARARATASASGKSVEASSSSAAFQGNSAAPVTGTSGRNRSRRNKAPKKEAAAPAPSNMSYHNAVWQEILAAESAEKRQEILYDALPKVSEILSTQDHMLIDDYNARFHPVEATDAHGNSAEIKDVVYRVRFTNEPGGELQTHHARIVNDDGTETQIDPDRVCALNVRGGAVGEVTDGSALLIASAKGVDGNKCTDPILMERIAAHKGCVREEIVGAQPEHDDSYVPSGATTGLDFETGVDLHGDEMYPENLEDIPIDEVVTVNAAPGQHILNHPLVRAMADCVTKAATSATPDENLANQTRLRFVSGRQAILDRYSTLSLFAAIKGDRESATKTMDPRTLELTEVTQASSSAAVGSTSARRGKTNRSYACYVEFRGKGLVTPPKAYNQD